VAGSTAAPARELPLQTLLDDAPGANPHVVLTHFNFTSRFVPAEGRFQSGWRCVWFVVTPPRKGQDTQNTDVDYEMSYEVLEGDGSAPRVVRPQRPLAKLAPAPKQIRALVMSKDLRNDADLGLFVQHHQDRLRGPVTVAADSLPRRDQEFLQQTFKDIDLNTCLIIHADGFRRDFVVLVALVLGAGFCFVTSGILVRRGRRPVAKAPAAPKPAEAKLDPAEEEALYLWQREQHQRRPPSNYL
jgi:hypothetical protein